MSCKAKTGTLEWAKKNVNDIRGCRNNCWYCYAKRMALRFKRIQNPGEWAHMDFVGAKDIPRNTSIMYPSSHDIFPEWIAEQMVTMWSILSKDNSLLIVSKPRKECIHKIIDWLNMKGEADTGPINQHPLNWKEKVEFRFSITSATPEISLKYEPGASLPQERVECLKMVLDAGFPASVSMEPYLEPPWVILEGLIAKTVAVASLKEFWIGKMNYGVPEELRGIYCYDAIWSHWQTFRHYPNARFKDSYQKLLHINCRGVPL
jgi:hypothetical protein